MTPCVTACPQVVCSHDDVMSHGTMHLHRVYAGFRKCPYPYNIHGNCVELYSSTQTTADSSTKVRNCPHYSRPLQFLRTAICEIVCSISPDMHGTIWYVRYVCTVLYRIVWYHTLSESALIALYVTNQPPKANSASIPPGSVNEYQLPGSTWAGKAKAGMVYSVSGCTQGVQVKLWDPLRTRAIPERLWGVITTRCYTNPHLPYFT